MPIRLLAIAALVALPSLASALTWGGAPSLLVPEAKTPIQLVELRVSMVQPKAGGRWQVEAQYKLKNRGARDYDLKLNLPEEHCNSDVRTCSSATAGHFHSLTTTVDGKEVKLAEAPAKAPDKTAEAKPEGVAQPKAKGRTWQLVLPLKGKKGATVVQRYEVEPTTDREGIVLTLGMGSAKLWHGPIVKVAIDVAQRQRPWTVGYPAAFNLTRYSADVPSEGAMKGGPATHLQFRMRRWRIAGPLYIHLATAEEVSSAHRCPDVRAVSDASRSKQSEAMLKQMLVMRNDAELVRCRKLYLALYGFPFSSKADRARFYGKPVRSASAVNTVLDGKRDYWRFGLQLNPTYTADLHSKMHQAYLDGLAQEQRRRRKK